MMRKMTGGIFRQANSRHINPRKAALTGLKNNIAQRVKFEKTGRNGSKF